MQKFTVITLSENRGDVSASQLEAPDGMEAALAWARQNGCEDACVLAVIPGHVQIVYPESGQREHVSDLLELGDYPASDWKHEVANGDTMLGYQEWLEHKLEVEKYDSKIK